MTFKFGLLVLFLALDANSAVEQKPTLPNPDAVSAVQKLTPIGISSMWTHRSEIQELLSTDFGTSMQSSESTCAWDVELKECSPSISSMKHLLENSKTDFAKMLVDRLTCVEKTDGASCDKEKACLWEPEMNECMYLDLRRGHKDSPCAKAAPRYFDFYDAVATCVKLNTSKPCESEKFCEWYEDYGECDPDYHFIDDGIKKFEEKFKAVTELAQDALATQYKVQQSADNFTWQSLLDYRPTSIECPPAVEQLVCDYATVYWSHTMGPQLYCHGKYESATFDCEADALCNWEIFASECKSDEDKTYLSSERSASRFLVDSKPDGTDKEIFEARYTCAFARPFKGCKGTCYFDQKDWHCIPRKDTLAALLTEPGKNSTDALCTYLKVGGFSPCSAIFSYKKCKKHKSCRWTGLLECVPNEEFYLLAAADEDPRLNRTYRKFKKSCASHTKEEACVEPTKAD